MARARAEGERWHGAGRSGNINNGERTTKKITDGGSNGGSIVKRNALILLGFLAAIAVVAVWQWPDRGPSGDSAASAPLEGQAAPAFSLASLDGTETYSVGGKRDRPLLLHFWASWCGPCEEEAPALQTLYEKYRDRIDLYAVNATRYDTVRGAQDFVRDLELTFPVLMDESGKVTDAYKVFAFPASFLVDRDGVVRERIDRVLTLEEWEQKIEAVL